MCTVAKWAGVVLGVLVVAFFAQRLIDPPDSGDDATFSEFLDQVEAGEVESVTLVPRREEIAVQRAPPPNPTTNTRSDTPSPTPAP
jgi:hypothetical protein